jgi:L-lactate dehydrogenase complex protein LldG
MGVGLFIPCHMYTGPFATADIEGVLIHGAQGVRSLTVILTA